MQIVRKEYYEGFLSKEQPVKWLQLQDVLNQPEVRSKEVVTFEFVQKEASEKCGIDSEEQLRAALVYLNDCGAIIYLGIGPGGFVGTDKELSSWVVVDPSWITSAVAHVLYAENAGAPPVDASLQKYIGPLALTGQLYEDLVLQDNGLWQCCKKDHRKLLLQLLTRSHIILKSGSSNDRKKIYYVPAKLPERIDDSTTTELLIADDSGEMLCDEMLLIFLGHMVSHASSQGVYVRTFRRNYAVFRVVTAALFDAVDVTLEAIPPTKPCYLAFSVDMDGADTEGVKSVLKLLAEFAVAAQKLWMPRLQLRVGIRCQRCKKREAPIDFLALDTDDMKLKDGTCAVESTELSEKELPPWLRTPSAGQMSKGDENAYVVNAWKQFRYDVVPKLFRDPTRTKLAEFGRGRNSLTGMYTSFLRNDTGELEYVLATASEDDLRTREWDKFFTEHLKLCTCLKEELVKDGSMKEDQPFVFAIGFSIDCVIGCTID